MKTKMESEKIEKYEKLTKITVDHCMNTDEAAKKIISLLKENCRTYGELSGEIKRLKTTSIWDGQVGDMSLINRCEKLVKEEMNDLKIIIHF